MNAALARRRDDLARVPSDADGKLLERCLICEQRLEPRLFLEPLLRVRGERQAGLPQLAQPLRPQPREVDEPAEREQRLVRGDVRRGLLPPDVLLAGLQGEDIAALARGVYRLADDPPWHASDELFARSEEAVVRPAEGREVAGRLSLAERERGSVAAGRLEHAERERGRRARSASAPASVAAATSSGAGSRQPKKFGCWKMTAAASAAARSEIVGIGHPGPVRHLDDLEAEAGAYVFTTWRTCGFVASVTTILLRPVACFAT